MDCPPGGPEFSFGVNKQVLPMGEEGTEAPLGVLTKVPTKSQLHRSRVY